MDPKNKLVTKIHTVPALIEAIGSARTGEHTSFTSYAGNRSVFTRSNCWSISFKLYDKIFT